MKQPKKLEDMTISDLECQQTGIVSIHDLKEWATAICEHEKSFGAWNLAHGNESFHLGAKMVIYRLIKMFELEPRKLDGKVKRMATLKGKVKA